MYELSGTESSEVSDTEDSSEPDIVPIQQVRYVTDICQYLERSSYYLFAIF